MNVLLTPAGDSEWRILAAGSRRCLLSCALTALALASMPAAAPLRAQGMLERVVLPTALERPSLAWLGLLALPLALRTLVRRGAPWPLALAFPALPRAKAGWAAGGAWNLRASPLAAGLLAVAPRAGCRSAAARSGECGQPLA